MIKCTIRSYGSSLVPAHKKYKTEEEKSEANKRNQNKYNTSEKRRKRRAEWHKHRYENDPEYRARVLQLSKEWHAKTSKEIINQKRREWGYKNRTKCILNEARKRAKIKNVPFDLTEKDIIVPELCPVLNIPLISGIGKRTDNSPSLDRVVPEKGYIKSNIRIISNRANVLKNNATIEELRAVIKYMEENGGLVRN